MIHDKPTGRNFGIGRLIYTEWLVPVHDYYISLLPNERNFEIVVPIVITAICSTLYIHFNKVLSALHGLSNFIPTAVSVLIGFTIMMITLLLTSSEDKIFALKAKVVPNKYLYQKPINLFQNLHIQFSHTLLTEIILLLTMLSYLFFSGFLKSPLVFDIHLILTIYFILNILFSIIRGITSLYFTFYKGT